MHFASPRCSRTISKAERKEKRKLELFIGLNFAGDLKRIIKNVKQLRLTLFINPGVSYSLRFLHRSDVISEVLSNRSNCPVCQVMTDGVLFYHKTDSLKFNVTAKMYVIEIF